MSGNNARWGCPDWRDKKSYPQTADDLKDWQWRWEFLKRTKGYRRAWDNGTPIDNDERRLLHPNDLEYSRIVWGLPNLPNPVSDFRGFHSIFSKRAGGLIRKMGLGHPFTDLLQEGAIALGVFDLNAPIKPQVETVTHLLKEDQKFQQGKLAQFKKRRENWPRHLRVIDADNQGAAPSQIWLEIMGDLLEVDEYDKRAGGNVSQYGKDMIFEARQIMEKASRFL
jgi:hypothetical protein